MIENLRESVPDFDTKALRDQWMQARKEIERVGELSVFRAMSIGTRQMLFQCVRAMGAKTVLDIGTYTGTSALCFALAVGEGGSVVTLDVVDANAPDGFWKQDNKPRSPAEVMRMAGVAERVEFLTMDAAKYLCETDRLFDFVCIDAGKNEEETEEQFKLVLEHMAPGGLIFFDDVFADGVPMPSGYYEPAHWNVLKRYQERGVIVAFPMTQALDGQRIACAWVVRA